MLSRLAMLQKSWRKPKTPSICSLARLKTIYSMNCQMAIHAISLLSKRKKKPPINTQEKQACLISGHCSKIQRAKRIKSNKRLGQKS